MIELAKLTQLSILDLDKAKHRICRLERTMLARLARLGL